MTNDAILSRIRALLSKTTENGCTEAEAMLAAQKAAELMDRHGFDANDLDEKEPITQDTYFTGGKHLGAVSKVAVCLADYCDVRLWAVHARKGSGKESEMKIFGHESDVMVCNYLLHLLSNAFETEWRDYFTKLKAVGKNHFHGKTMRASFESGMASRINKRLRAMKEARNASVDTKSGKTGRDLVLVKNQEVETAFKALEIKLKNNTTRRTIHDYGAFDAGDAAGNRVNITSGVGKGATAGLLK